MPNLKYIFARLPGTKSANFYSRVKELLYTHTLEFEDSMKMLAKILDGRNIKLTRVEKITDVTDTNNVDAVLRRYANQGTCVWMKIYIR